MNEKLEKLNHEMEKTEARLRRAQHKEKMLEHQIKTLNRKERTHRLCTRGAMLESHLPHPESVTDGQVSTILKVLFCRSDTKRLVEQVLAENRKAGCGALWNKSKPERDVRLPVPQRQEPKHEG